MILNIRYVGDRVVVVLVDCEFRHQVRLLICDRDNKNQRCNYRSDVVAEILSLESVLF
jgi:hypothetical protein